MQNAFAAIFAALLNPLNQTHYRQMEKYKALFELFLNKEIEKKRTPNSLYAPINYVLQSPGKRIRPVSLLMATEAFGGDGSKALGAAMSVEVFHNFTLMHDDLMDNAPLRRGRPTVHSRNPWDANTAILSGDAMFGCAYQYLEMYPAELFKKLTSLLSKAALEVCEGQALDMDFENTTNISYQDYLEMIGGKTASLTATAMEMGSLIANASVGDRKLIYHFGYQLGLAFQLQDDYLDTFGNTAKTGKIIGGDILEGKKTALYVKACELLAPSDTAEFISIYNALSPLSESERITKIQKVVSFFEKSGVKEFLKREIETLHKDALEALGRLSIAGDKKDTFKSFSKMLMERNH